MPEVTGAVPVPSRRGGGRTGSGAVLGLTGSEGIGMEPGSGTGLGTGMRMGVLPPSRPTPVSTATLSAAVRPRPAPRLGQWRGGARPGRR